MAYDPMSLSQFPAYNSPNFSYFQPGQDVTALLANINNLRMNRELALQKGPLTEQGREFDVTQQPSQWKLAVMKGLAGSGNPTERAAVYDSLLGIPRVAGGGGGGGGGGGEGGHWMRMPSYDSMGNPTYMHQPGVPGQNEWQWVPDPQVRTNVGMNIGGGGGYSYPRLSSVGLGPRSPTSDPFENVWGDFTG